MCALKIIFPRYVILWFCSLSRVASSGPTFARRRKEPRRDPIKKLRKRDTTRPLAPHLRTIPAIPLKIVRGGRRACNRPRLSPRAIALAFVGTVRRRWRYARAHVRKSLKSWESSEDSCRLVAGRGRPSTSCWSMLVQGPLHNGTVCAESASGIRESHVFVESTPGRSGDERYEGGSRRGMGRAGGGKSGRGHAFREIKS